MTVAAGAVTVRPVVATDEPFRRGLFAQSRPDLAQLPSGVRDQVLDLQWRAQARQVGLDHPSAGWDVIELDGAPVGQLVADVSGADVHLVDLAVAAEHRGRGVARQALLHLIALGRGIELSVWSGNHVARRLYESVDFAYLTTDEDGYLPMRRTSSEVVR